MTTAVRAVFDVGLAVTVLWLLRRVWQGRMDWIDGAAWATFALLATAWSMLPWYVCWMLPLVALSTSRRLWTGHDADDPDRRGDDDRRRHCPTAICDGAPYDGGVSADRELALLSVVAPVYQEEATIERFCAAVADALSASPTS